MRRSDTGLIVGLLLFFTLATGWLLLRSQKDVEKAYPPFSSFSPRPQGLMAYYELLRASGFEPLQFGETIYHYPERGCMLLASESAPDISNMLGSVVDERSLRLWLEDGGRLLLVCDRDSMFISKLLVDELGFSPAPVYAAPPGCAAARQAGGQAGEISALSRVYRPGAIYELDSSRPMLWSEVERLEISESYGTYNADLQTLLGVFDPNMSAPDLQPVVLYTPVGEGEIIWLTAPELLSNKWIARVDNHKLGLALASFAVRPTEAGGEPLPLYFDENIHGYGRETLNEISVLTQTTGGRLLLVSAALLVLLFFGAAIRPARFFPLLTPQRRQATEMVHAQADLYRRAGARFSLAESLVDGLRRAYASSRHVSSMPSDRMLLEWLERSGADEPALRDFLRSKILPPVPRRLLELAQSCDRLRRRLEQGSI
ncbi:hypothetical protein IT575_15285 [bacterium]|nr:hypothetical protein [bacterium]